MKPSVTSFVEVPRELNRLAARGGKDYEQIAHFIGLLSEAEAVEGHLKRTIARAAGLRHKADYGTPMVERRPFYSADALPQLISAQCARLCLAPAPRSAKEWAGQRAAPTPLAALAQRIAQLFLSGLWANLHRCEVCETWFLGRRQAKTCKAACREKKTETRATFKRQRREWLLNKKHIPRIKARLQRLQGPANRLRRVKWKNRLKDYQRELQKIRRKGK